MNEKDIAFSRTAMLVGAEGVKTLGRSRVAVFGVGGVGGAVCEALARAGVGALDLFDDDVVSASNLNRQVVALHSSLGRPKVEVMAERILDINPGCAVRCHRVFYTPASAGEYPLDGYDYVVDAIDTVSAKIALAERACAAGVPAIASMGAGNKLHPERFEVTTIDKTTTCPLARVMRRELGRRGIKKLKVVYSREQALTPRQPAVAEPAGAARPGSPKRQTPGSISFVPAAAGLVLAGEVVRDLLGVE